MHQVVEMSDKEKFDVYMTLPKENLANMLIECNKQIQRLVKPTIVYSDQDNKNK